MRKITEAIVHCAATRPAWMAGSSLADKKEEIKRWHVEDRGWRDIGYHFLIDRNGDTIVGRNLDVQGAHCRGRNKGTVGICLLGGHGSSERDDFSDHFTPEQEASLRELLGTLDAKLGKLKVSGHNQYAAKACPGFYVPDWYNSAPAKRIPLPLPKEVCDVVGDADKSPAASTTNWGAVLGIAGSAWAAFQSAEPTVQAASIFAIAVLLYIMRERIRKANLGKLAQQVLGT